MANIEKTEHGTYRVRFRTPDGRSRSKSFKRRVEADAFAATVETSKLQGTYTDPALGKTRFGEWAKHVQASRDQPGPVHPSPRRRLLPEPHPPLLHRYTSGESQSTAGPKLGEHARLQRHSTGHHP